MKFKISIIIKRIIPLYIGFLYLFILFSCDPANPEKPNVILVITDDQGYGDLACHSNEVIQTPHLDQLHNESFRFVSFHVGTTCAPTRAGLMTGRNANRNGVWHTIGGCSMLNQEETTMADVFSENGYKTGMFGKWHLGDTYPFRPHDRGFDEAFYHGGGGITQTPDYWLNDYFDDTYFRNGEPEKATGYCTDVWFKEAISFIEKNKNQPFFCYLSTNAPHAPFNVPEGYYQMYEDERLMDFQKRFYGMITNIDDNMGMLMEKMDKMGVADNTILIFMSDNGTAAGYKPDPETGEMIGFNAGMRGTKGSPYEGGHRVPFFMRWPGGNISGGKDVDALSAHVDLLPTLAELCGIDFNPTLTLDGTSLAAMIRGEEAPDTSRMLITDTQRIQWPKKGRNSCVMQGSWRLMMGTELYNIEDDPGQKTNVADMYPERVARMQAFYDQWWSEIEPEMEYSYIDVGTEHQDRVIITAHDVHAPSGSIPWNQGLIREGNKNPEGYFCIEVTTEGPYLVELARWPFESGLTFEDSVSAVEGTYYRDGYPAGEGKQFEKAFVQIVDGKTFSGSVDNKKQTAAITCALPKGKHHMKFYFEDAAGNTTAAYYISVMKTD